ncbi:cache domain-containing sensor histidine kinase [Paenibacillus harenae]|uniref:Two-component system sensor histidine kinase YesM n=1 Tax=Paenibacillus harenae TaxID=306543 RepID=A0ABT9U632_PAEHA|nr:sensor histidine kinase [Paenibacillus harenae]MDQ0113894.1 two-component system sensor histidine kinase YesM [Paenibacillus harenae]
MSLRRSLERIVIEHTSKMNLRGKILILYGAIIFIPTIFLGVGAGYFSLESFRDNYLVTINEAMRQTVQNIEFRKQSYDVLATRTATDGELISRLSRDYSNMFEQLNTVEYVDRSFVFTSKYLPGIDDFRIYHTNPMLVQDGRLLWKPEDRILQPGFKETDWFAKASEAPGALLWSNMNKDKLVISHKIMSPAGDLQGIIYLLLDYKTVFGELFDRPFSGSGELSIMDDYGTIIVSSDPGKIGLKLHDTALSNHWEEASLSDGVMVDGNLLMVRPIGSNWHVAALIQMDQLERQSKTILYGIIAVIFVFLLCSTFLIMTVLKNVVWRIRKLGTRMYDVSQGQFDVSIRNTGKDELGDLEVLFNSMSGRLGMLVEDITQAKLKEREQSFKALQAQINPHFIYNSLSLLRWRAMDLQDETQLRTIDALTAFYRLALDNKINVTQIKGELDHVRAYLDIQEMRYPGRVTTQWHIDPELLELYTIKLLLQPIVENCYLHGNITGKKGAVIRISAQLEQDHVRFEVFDNGRGIPGDMLEQIRLGKQAGNGNGFGTANIRERLQLYFENKHEFTIASKENEWTAVTITIPACVHRPQIRKVM